MVALVTTSIPKTKDWSTEKPDPWRNCNPSQRNQTQSLPNNNRKKDIHIPVVTPVQIQEEKLAKLRDWFTGLFYNKVVLALNDRISDPNIPSSQDFNLDMQFRGINIHIRDHEQHLLKLQYNGRVFKYTYPAAAFKNGNESLALAFLGKSIEKIAELMDLQELQAAVNELKKDSKVVNE